MTCVGMADFADSFPNRELSVCTRAQYPYLEKKLAALDRTPVVFAQEFFPEYRFDIETEPFTVIYDEKADEYVVEGPRIEKMLSYTNLESEKGFKFFQDFMKKNGILEQLEALGIQEGSTVRMYGLSFDYYR